MLCFRYVLRQVFRNKGKGAGRGTQYIITRVQVRASLVRAKKIRNGENSCRMERKIPLEGWNSLSDDTKKIRKYSPRKGKMDHPQGKFMLKKADFSFEKIQEKHKNTGTKWKISQFRSGKGKKNYSDEAKKSQKTDDPDGKSSRFFVGGRKNTEMHGKRSRKIYRIIRKKHERYTADRNKFCH